VQRECLYSLYAWYKFIDEPCGDRIIEIDQRSMWRGFGQEHTGTFLTRTVNGTVSVTPRRLPGTRLDHSARQDRRKQTVERLMAVFRGRLDT